MQPIISGTTTERIVRTLGLVILVTAFAIAYLWDGYVGYARENAEKLADSLGLALDEPPATDPKLTATSARRLVEEFGPGTRADAVTDRLGPAPIQREEEAYYLGPGGYLRVRTEHGAVVDAQWTNGPLRTEGDLVWQRRIGYVLGVLGVILLLQAVRVMSTRVTLSDAGLKVDGRPVIPFAAMRALRANGRGKSARVELTYSLDGREGQVRLDDYVVKEYRAIVTEICERAGFPDPLRAPDDRPDRDA